MLLKLSSSLCLGLCLLSFNTKPADALDYALTGIEDGGLVLTDNSTGITDLITIFNNDVTLIDVTGLVWESTGMDGGDDFLNFTTLVDGVVQDQGSIDLSGFDRQLPSTVSVGSVSISKSGKHTIDVVLAIDSSAIDVGGTYQVYRPGVSLIPLIFILVMALTTQMVELSLFLGIWLGACIVTGSLADGFRSTIVDFILNALYNWGHVAVILFTVFLSGLVGMMQKSGGMLGFTRDMGRIATTPRSGQYACMAVGIIIFFDDYANILLAGETMRPLLDLLFVSREKLSFIVDATSAPIASISPISSWVGFEVGLLNDELEKIVNYVNENGLELTIKDTGFAIFLQSIKYRYYPIFMIILMGLLIGFQRDFGPMLLAERQVRVYDRTDGGPNKGKTDGMEGAELNQPREDQPLKSWNMLLPVAILVALIFWALVQSGDDDSGTQTFMEKIENSDSYIALMYGTMGTAWIALILYLCQITIPGSGTLALPTPQRLWDMMPWRSEKVEVQPRFLMSVNESVEAFLFGMARIFLALVVLTLAWACGDLMTSVGADRLFAAWIVGGVDFRILPTLSFLVSLLMALATGTSWGTMSILFPLITLPTYQASNGDPLTFYATVAGVLSGSVAGDHMSPISDTTVLSALACDVTLMAHVTTQAPYVLVMVLFSVLFGTLPIGYDAWPNMVGIALGWVITLAFVYLLCVPVISPTGRWDPIFKYTCGRRHDQEFLARLQEDTIKKYNGETVELKSAEDEMIEEVGNTKKDGGVDESSEEDDKATPAEAAVENSPEESHEEDA